ncbi:hypothetical protein Daudx_0736 [Candidatus Desulforudis audaxviator]|nr:hypothetical protein Daudx_0736 [Candidatus Desulforudis audaxviator]
MAKKPDVAEFFGLSSTARHRRCQQVLRSAAARQSRGYPL